MNQQEMKRGREYIKQGKEELTTEEEKKAKSKNKRNFRTKKFNSIKCRN
jgi:hypothetical protein